MDHFSQGFDVGCQTNTQQEEISMGCILRTLLNSYSVADKAKYIPARCNFPSSLCWQAVLSMQSCRRATTSIWSCCSYRDLTALIEGGETLAGPALLGQEVFSSGLEVRYMQKIIHCA